MLKPLLDRYLNGYLFNWGESLICPNSEDIFAGFKCELNVNNAVILYFAGTGFMIPNIIKTEVLLFQLGSKGGFVVQIDVSNFHGACSCGRSHEIFVKEILVEENALKKLPEKLSKIYTGAYTDISVICDTNTYQAAGEAVEKLLPGCNMIILPAKDLHADNHGVALAEKGLKISPDTKLIIAVGSGTVHDISRYLSKDYGLNFVSVPTAASVDGFVSTVSAMTWNGLKKTMPGVSPELVIADTKIFSKAPYRLTASGISDLLGKYTALTDWEISHMVTGEYICHRVCELEMTALKEVCSCIEDLRGSLEEEKTLKAYEQLMYALLLSGIAMQMIGNSRPASGAEHHISHLWEMEVINGPLDAYHGEKVSIGLMIVVHTYHKIKNAIKNGICKVIPYKGMELEVLQETFGKKELYEGILEENTPDPLALVDSDKLNSQLPSIAGVLDKLPSESELLKLLSAAGCKKEMKEISLEEKLLPITIRLAPYVRNRLTFLRLSKLFKIKNET